MATGSGIPQPGGIVTSDITPGYAIPHDHAIADALGNAGDAAQGLINHALERHYAQKGAQEGAVASQAQADVTRIASDPNGSDTELQAAQQRLSDASKTTSIPVITDIGKARQAAFQGAYLGGIKTDIDSHIDQTRNENALDPDAFKTAAQQVVSGYAKGAPGPFAVQVQQYAQAQAADAFQKLSNQKLVRDQATSVNGMNARQQALQDKLLGMAASGQDNTPEFAAAQDEWQSNNLQKASNPLFEFSPDQASEAAAHAGEQLQGAVLTHHATLAYMSGPPDENGNPTNGGEAGKQAALALIQKEMLTPEPGSAAAAMPAGMRLKLYAVARANITDLDKADAESRAIAAEQARQKQADQRDAAGTLALGLQDGSVSEADIHDAESKGQIQDGAAARLINGSRAMARRDAAEGRAADAITRTANYGALSELAEAGKLTPAGLAENDGALTSMQRLAIGARINKVTGPTVSRIVDLAKATFRDAGIQGEAADLAIEHLKVDAAQYAKNNPSATVGQGDAFTADWVRKTKGIAVPTNMNPPSSAHLTDTQIDNAFKAKFHSQSPSQGQVDANRAAFRAAHPK